MSIQAPTVPHHLTVQNGGVTQELFMSFGLLNRLTRHLGNIDQLPLLAVDPEMQETIILEMFTERDKSGVATKIPASLDDIQVSLDDIDLVLDFVGDHIANFFVRSAEKAQKRLLEIHERVNKASILTPTKSGSSP